MSIVLTLPEMPTGELQFILGRPNFWCAQFAHLMRKAHGLAIAERSEDEQAWFMCWALRLYALHGDEWRDVAQMLLKEAAEKLKVAEKLDK